MAVPEKTQGWVTGVTSLQDGRSILHGYDVLELASRYDFTSVMFLTWTGELPTPPQKAMLDAILSCVVVHGVAPTGALARGFIRSGVPVQVAISGALLSLGDVHGGAGEQLGETLHEAMAEVGHMRGHPYTDQAVARCADVCVQSFRARGLRVPGLGHPAHPEGDPRATMLFAKAQELGVAEFACAVTRRMELLVGQSRGRPIPCNVDGAMTAILEDLGIGWRFSRIALLVSRAVGLGAQVIEEQQHPTPNWRDAILPAETYVGPAPRTLPKQ